MGIQSLLKSLEPHLVDCEQQYLTTKAKETNLSKSKKSKLSHNIRQFSNQSLCVDASSWLYKASYSCAHRLVENSEQNKCKASSDQSPDSVVEKTICKYMVNRCEELLLGASIKKIYLVFDGKRSPLKAGTNKERELKRETNLREARRLHREGRKREAHDKYQACIKVEDWMGRSVARAVMRKWGNNCNSRLRVHCVFSPYEADAQLVKLCTDGLTHAVITEDSDVLVYSAACGMPFPIIYKLDRKTGNCNVFSMDWLLSSKCNPSLAMIDEQSTEFREFSSIRRCLVASSAKQKKGKSGPGSAFLSHLRALVVHERKEAGSGARIFVQSCILSGCDYAPSCLAGAGIVTAFKMMRENSNRDPGARFMRILKSFPKDKKITYMCNEFSKDPNRNSVIESYEEILSKSEIVFYHHFVQQFPTGKICSLVQVEQTKIENNGMMKEKLFLPCFDRFAKDMSFVGPEFMERSGSRSILIPYCDSQQKVASILESSPQFKNSLSKNSQKEVDLTNDLLATRVTVATNNKETMNSESQTAKNTTEHTNSVVVLTESETLMCETKTFPQLGNNFMKCSKISNPFTKFALETSSSQGKRIPNKIGKNDTVNTKMDRESMLFSKKYEANSKVLDESKNSKKGRDENIADKLPIAAEQKIGLQNYDSLPSAKNSTSKFFPLSDKYIKVDNFHDGFTQTSPEIGALGGVEAEKLVKCPSTSQINIEMVKCKANVSCRRNQYTARVITPLSKVGCVTDQGTFFKPKINVEFPLDKVKVIDDISSDSDNSEECSVIEGIIVKRKMRMQSKKQTQSCDGSPDKKAMQKKFSREYYPSQASKKYISAFQSGEMDRLPSRRNPPKGNRLNKSKSLSSLFTNKGKLNMQVQKNVLKRKRDILPTINSKSSNLGIKKFFKPLSTK